MHLEPTHGIRGLGGIDMLPVFLGLHKSFDATGTSRLKAMPRSVNDKISPDSTEV